MTDVAGHFPQTPTTLFIINNYIDNKISKAGSPLRDPAGAKQWGDQYGIFTEPLRECNKRAVLLSR